MKANQVFTPGAFPKLTYVERSGTSLEQKLRDAIDTPGQVVSLVGPSKSGKTVLVEKVVGADSLITITGAGIEHADDIWRRVLDWIGAPATEIDSAKKSRTSGVEASAKGSGNILVIEASAQAKGNVGFGREQTATNTYERTGLQQVVKEIGDSEFVVLIDDFHYMPRKVQEEAAKTLKEAVRLGVKVCTAAVRHRGDDLVRANPELRGRVRAVDIQYWSPSDLRQIATAGFSALNAVLENDALDRLTIEAAGSPQLMQLLCLHACYVLNVRAQLPNIRNVTVTMEQLRNILEDTSSNTDFRSLVDVLDAGPKTRGTERKEYLFKDGSKGDVYRCVLKALASDPPRLSFGYDDLLSRTVKVCAGESPVGSSVAGTCLHMGRLALENFPLERAIDWDEQKQILDIPDPYLLFYLRWSGRLSEPS